MGKRAMKTERVSYRWPELTVGRVRGLAERTGWSEAKAAAALIAAGHFAMQAKAGGTEELRREIEDAATLHAAKEKAAEIVRAAKAKVRKARSSRPPTKAQKEATALAGEVLGA